MEILVLNAGSSSLKFQLLHALHGAERRVASGRVERIGSEAATLTLEREDEPPHIEVTAVRDVAEALRRALEWVAGTGGAAVGAVGHRVVHGGETFRSSVRVDEGVRRRLEETVPLAPLHNPHNLRGIDAARAALGDRVPQVAVFDTAFHQTMPEHAYRYALPAHLYERHGVRRYGFHGTSHRYVSDRYHLLARRAPAETRLITLHLGNGCSACAIRGGVSVDTSMGFTPLEGLVMGTRAGDTDPALLPYIAEREGIPMAEALRLLNEESGLRGVSGLTHDVRDLLAAAGQGHAGARLALDIYAYRARKYLGAYLAALGGAEAVVFTGGVGENAPAVRRLICEGMGWAGLELDDAANRRMVQGAEGPISTPGTRLAGWVIPTDEERMIARETLRVIEG